MNVDLDWGTQNHLLLFLILFAFPIVVTVGAEFVLTKKVSTVVIIFTVLLGAVLYGAGLVQVNSTQVVLSDDELQLKSLMYTRNISLADIDDISPLYTENLPETLIPKIRTNGIGLPDYRVGSFMLQDNTSAFLLLSKPPYVMLSVSEQKQPLIFSASEAFYNELMHKVSKN